MGAYEVHIANLLSFFLAQFVVANDLGLVEVEMLFDFGKADRPKRRPDVAFISHGRWPKGQKVPSAPAWAVVPDLVVEVISPTDLAVDVESKIVEYLEAGVDFVWVVYPSTSRIYIFDGSPTVRVVSRAGEIEGGVILPDFRLAVNRIFADDPA